jgi:hypothetical protein
MPRSMTRRRRAVSATSWVVAGVGDGGDGLDQGVQEGAAADVGQLAGVVQLPQHRHRVGGLAAVGQPQDGPPDGSMGRPVEVGLLEDGGDLDEQPPRCQDCSKHRLLGFQVVRWLPVGWRHRAQAAPVCPWAWPGSGHRRGLRAPLPRRRCGGGGGRCWSRICLT